MLSQNWFRHWKFELEFYADLEFIHYCLSVLFEGLQRICKLNILPVHGEERG